MSAAHEAELLAAVPTGLFIAGQWRDAHSGATFPVVDPATGEVLAHVADASPETAPPPSMRPRPLSQRGPPPPRASVGRSCGGRSSW